MSKNCVFVGPSRQFYSVRQPVGFFVAKFSAEKTEYIDVSQPPHQGKDAKETLKRR